jgi:hypothetical protein
MYPGIKRGVDDCHVPMPLSKLDTDDVSVAPPQTIGGTAVGDGVAVFATGVGELSLGRFTGSLGLSLRGRLWISGRKSAQAAAAKQRPARLAAARRANRGIRTFMIAP